jgi:hypothetical protein
MTTRWLLRLYPEDWRARYEDEFVALLEDCPSSPRVLLDVVAGALDTRLHPQAVLGRILSMTNRLRSAEITIFYAFILFVLSGMGFQKMSEDFVHVKDVYPAIGICMALIVIGAVVSLLAVLAGGLPIVFTALRFTFRQRRWDIPLLFLVPPSMLVLWLGYLYLRLNGLVLGVAPTVPNRSAVFGLAISVIGFFIVVALMSTSAVALAVVRSEISERIYRFALLPSVVAVMAMMVVLAAVIAWGINVQADAPQLYNGNHGILASPTAFSWIGSIVTMALAVLIALAGLRRGLGARSIGSQPATM